MVGGRTEYGTSTNVLVSCFSFKYQTIPEIYNNAYKNVYWGNTNILQNDPMISINLTVTPIALSMFALHHSC